MGQPDRRARPSAPTWRFDRLERLYETQGTPQRFDERCRRLIAANPQDWRARLALGRHLAKRERPAGLRVLLEALEHNPHGLTVHQAIWDVLLQLELDRALVQRYIESARTPVFFLDPHVCLQVPLPQHRAALAVPALPRVEQLRRGADRAAQEGDGRDVRLCSRLRRASASAASAARLTAASVVLERSVGVDHVVGPPHLVARSATAPPAALGASPSSGSSRAISARSASSRRAGRHDDHVEARRRRPVSNSSGISATANGVRWAASRRTRRSRRCTAGG